MVHNTITKYVMTSSAVVKMAQEKIWIWGNMMLQDAQQSWKKYYDFSDGQPCIRTMSSDRHHYHPSTSERRKIQI